MKERVFIAIDSGKYATKGIMNYNDQIYTVMFRTKLQEATNIGIDIQPNSFKVEYEGKTYLIGDMVAENQSDFDLSKESLIHKLAIYIALVELMRKANINFYSTKLHIAVNCPINVYRNQLLKDSFKNFIINNNEAIFIKVNEKSHNFNIDDLTICFEGMGLIYANPNDYIKSTSVIIDIGGLNTTYCSFNGIQPVTNSMIVSHLGTNTLKAELEKELIQKYNRNISSNDLEQIIRKGYLTQMGQIVESSKEIIETMKLNHLKEIFNFAKRHGFTFTEDKMVFSGGGSLLLHKEINNNFPNALLAINPIFANTKSFLEILKVKYSS